MFLTLTYDLFLLHQNGGKVFFRKKKFKKFFLKSFFKFLPYCTPPRAPGVLYPPLPPIVFMTRFTSVKSSNQTPCKDFFNSENNHWMQNPIIIIIFEIFTESFYKMKVV